MTIRDNGLKDINKLLGIILELLNENNLDVTPYIGDMLLQVAKGGKSPYPGSSVMVVLEDAHIELTSRLRSRPLSSEPAAIGAESVIAYTTNNGSSEVELDLLFMPDGTVRYKIIDRDTGNAEVTHGT